MERQDDRQKWSRKSLLPPLLTLTKKGKALSFLIGGFVFSVERSGQQFLVSVNTLC